MYNRREFLKLTGIASTSMMPLISALGKALEIEPKKLSRQSGTSFNTSYEFHLIDNNLLNLHFYFINTKANGKFLQPINETSNSFMVVRLPQMHVSEKGFYTLKPDSLPTANLSGYSYLAFQLWPDELKLVRETQEVKRERNIKRSIMFNAEALLNWNDRRSFELITLVEWFQLRGREQFIFSDIKDCDNFKARKLWNLTNQQVSEEEYYSKEIKLPRNSFDFKKYQSLIYHFFDNNLDPLPSLNQFIPVTILEVPQGVIMVPIARDQDGNLARDLKRPIKEFWKNKLVNQKKVKPGFRKYEVWHNLLSYKVPIKTEPGTLESNFQFETPSFRVAGILADPKLFQCAPQEDETCEIPTTTSIDSDVLPNLLDKIELAFLTQYAKKEFTDPKFDIREASGLLFTGLGIITHLKYYQEDAPPGIDLIEYEHIITEGRDVFIKVARIGIHNKKGTRYKHVIEGKRKVELASILRDGATLNNQPTSFIELKQYCESLEKRKIYEFTPDQADNFEKTANFEAPQLTSPPAIFSTLNERIHFRRFPWREIRTIERKRQPILPFQDDENGVNIQVSRDAAYWFWPILDVPGPINYFESEFEADDWDAGTLKLKTPFIFIRKSVFECSAVGNGVSTNDIKAAIAKSFFRVDMNVQDHPANTRRKIQVDNKIAFTRPLEYTDNSTNVDKSKNKTHIIETEFVDPYFTFNKDIGNNIETFSKSRFPLLPQILRAKVFLDHVKDLTQKRIPSIVEYHSDYINHEFKNLVDDVKKEYANAGKLILANTKAFIEIHEETANQTYLEMTGAFEEAKNRLGNLAVPSVIPSSVSLADFGITLPRDPRASINKGRAVFDSTLQKLASLNPRELLQGKLSDICGLDLTSILDEVIPSIDGNNQTPLFEIVKTLNKLEGEILNSPVYKSIVEFKIKDPFPNPDGTYDELPPDKLIYKYEGKINAALQSIETQRLKLNDAIKKISAEIPNAEELDNLFKSLFEQVRTEVFDFALNQLPFDQVKQAIDVGKGKIETFLKNETLLLTQEFKANRDKLEDFFRTASKDVESLPPVLQVIGTIKIVEYIETELRELYKSTDFCDYATKINVLLETAVESEELIVDGVPVCFVKDLSKSSENNRFILTKVKDVDNVLLFFQANVFGGFVQLENKIATLKHFVANNIGGNNFQQRAAIEIQKKISSYATAFDTAAENVKKFQEQKLSTIVRNIDDWHRRAEEYLKSTLEIPPNVIDAIKKVDALIKSMIPIVDFLRKCDPYFYYEQQQRLRKQITDIERRFQQKYYDKYKKRVEEVRADIVACYNESMEYARAIEEFSTDPRKLDTFKTAREEFLNLKSKTIDTLNEQSDKIVKELVRSPEFESLASAYADFNLAKSEIEKAQAEFKLNTERYKTLLQQNLGQIAHSFEDGVKTYIKKREDELIDTIGAENILRIHSNIEEAKNIYRLVTSIKQQDLLYSWNTTAFRDINLGIVSFKKFAQPDTSLAIDVKSTVHFSAGKFPPTIEKVVTYSENRFKNFGICFFDSLTIGFNEVVFIAGSDRSTHFDIKIKDVKFDGALSFVQAFESWLKTMGKGLILELKPDHVGLGYSLPIPAIQTPGFSIFNLSLNFDLRVYFDKRPLRLGFSLARPESKFGIAVGIYAGFGFFGIVVDAKKGIVEIDCALEAGAWAGISIGPISGEVKLAFGFRYTKNEFGVRIEGYIVAEGRLSVWILQVSARIYLGIVSENSYVEGICTVTYSVKLGFIKKSFSGSFHKRIAGATTNNSGENAEKIFSYQAKIASSFGLNMDTKTFQPLLVETLDELSAGEQELETGPVSFDSWNEFISRF